MSNASVIEAMLLRWGETPAGRTVTLLLPDDTPHHPFKGLRSGASNGQRLGCAFTLINDDETTTPVEPPSTAPEKPKGGDNGNGADRRRFEDLPYSTQAALACKRVAFRRWLREFHGIGIIAIGDVDDDPVAVAGADRWLKSTLGITSKTDLDKSPELGKQWSNIYGHFQDWLTLPDARG